ncbi:MAG TPA: response regulator [Caldilineaceae bacterium]|nr:response regulator [Caldilineaceae bacterium]
MQTPQILVVDDEPLLRNLLERSLKRAGYRVVTASNGADALALFAATPIDLALVDVMMPGIDGYRVCEELRQWSSVPVILLTSLDNADEIVHGFSVGADDYITKPFQFRDLEVRIQALLRRATPQSPQ